MQTSADRIKIYNKNISDCKYDLNHYNRPAHERKYIRDIIARQEKYIEEEIRKKNGNR